MNKPLLSLCIPTYNRAKYLEKSLESLVGQKCFNSNEIEVVISDNNSTDNTYEICSLFCSIHSNIHYFKNDENIGDMNFPTVILKGNGLYRKICNDTIIYHDDMIIDLIELVNENKTHKPILFFLNKNDSSIHFDFLKLKNIDMFVKIVGYNMTWLCSFGLWENDIILISNFFSGCETNLWQVKTLLELVRMNNYIVIINKKFFTVNPQTKNKDLSYGVIKVFYDNFITIYLKSLLDDQLINEQTYKCIRKKLLLKYFAFLFVNLKFMKNTKLSNNENIDDMIKSRYSKDCYYYINYRLIKFTYFIYKKYLRKYLRKDNT